MPILLEQMDEKRLVRIYQTEGSAYVLAHLPESFGMSSGAEISAPFASFVSDGTAAGLLRLVGVSNKIGLSTTKVFIGPEHPPVTLDLKFVAYYNALEEVVLPVFQLLAMSAGKEQEAGSDIDLLQEYIDSLKTAINAGIDYAGDFVKQEKFADKVTESIKNFKITYLRSPSPVQVKMGNIFTIPNCFISNVDPRFSNILDGNGYPIEATVSLTLDIVTPPTSTDFIKSLHRPSSRN